MSDAVKFEQVFADELKVIDKRRAAAGMRPDPLGCTPERAFNLGLVGLAFSGGGIRSASFNLGVLQALAKQRVLEGCDYLSTVSGGGYIGSCLSALCSDGSAGVSPGDFPFAFDGREERPEVKRLRQHGEYLAPAGGLLQLATWRIVSTYVGRLLITLSTIMAILGVAAAAWIIVYPKIVNLALGMRGEAPVLDGLLWGKPRDHITALFAPAAVVSFLWLATTLMYAVVTVVPRLWTLRFREGFTRFQAILLRLAFVLAVAGVLPLLLVYVDKLVTDFKLAFSVPAALSALSVAGSRLLGEEAKGLPAMLKRGLVAAGMALFVAIVCIGVLYVVWGWANIAGTIFALLLGVLVLLALFTDINRVSMHYFYRDRLSEAFIVRHDRGRGDQLVSADDLMLSALAYPDRRVPYHLVNTCVNLLGSDDPALRGRKADFFLLSPLYCGSRATGYRRTAEYENDRMSLATAMAVSGAAASPQHGYGSSTAMAFLMTLLNVRLGIWAENPRNRPSLLGGWLTPRRLWPLYLCRELFNDTDEQRWLVNLSDGGHIENLAVYELLRRRCKVIIASDAEADPKRTFGGLGGVIRKARIDMGIEIKVSVNDLVPDPGSGLSKLHAVKGEIRYPKGDGTFDVGTLVYIKSSLTGDDPRDLHEYRSSHDTFPHESTADQFFDEAQFESYRELGYRSGKAAAALMGVAAARASLPDGGRPPGEPARARDAAEY